jgi:phosphatidylserine synthase
MTNTGEISERVPPSPRSLIQMSNLLTYAAVVASIVALWGAAELGSTAIVGIALAAATVLDTFDGRFARRFDRTAFERAFGGQLDSLADAIVSGIVPVVCVIHLFGRTAPPVQRAALWGCGVLWAIAAITRLGYFNLTDDDADDRFVGLPAPVASLIVATAMLWPLTTVTVAALMATLTVAMVSGTRFPRPRGLAFWAFGMWPAIVAAIHATRLL